MMNTDFLPGVVSVMLVDDAAMDGNDEVTVKCCDDGDDGGDGMRRASGGSAPSGQCRALRLTLTFEPSCNIVFVIPETI